jgi:hypothetical protein
LPLDGGPQLPPLQLHDEGIERPVENLIDIIRANGMAEQGLGVAQLIVGALAEWELEEDGRLGL